LFRWVDLVRSSIVFDELKDLVACFEEVSKDERISIMKVKNRLDPSYDAMKLSAGYRDVCILVVLKNGSNDLVERSLANMECSPQSQYICELQLQWEPFYRIKSAEGHARYVEFRNQLAE
jgi:hypothetical protein